MQKLATLTALALVLALSVAANAAVLVQNGITITTTSVASASNPALTVHKVNLSVNNGDKIIGWDGTITGNLSQQNPFGFLATIFSDNNQAFASDTTRFLDQDSQYLYLTNAADPVGGALAGASFEDTTQLSAGFALVGAGESSQAAAVHDLAQVVMANGLSATLQGALLLEASDLSQYIANLSFAIPIPEPATLAVLGLGGLLMARRRRR